MKATTIFLSVLLLSAPLSTRADSDVLWGALVGGAVGAIVGENSSDIRTEYAVPAFAALGALAAHAYGNRNDNGYYYDDGYYDRGYRSYDRRYSPHRYYDNDRYYGNTHYRHFDRSGHDYNVSYPYWPEPIPRYRRVREASAPPQTAPRSAAVPAEPAPNVHPGVSVVLIPVEWPNGLTRNIRIMRVNGRFVGPQGEYYDTLPDQAALAERYVPALR